MSGRVARQGWVSQPQHPVQIDWANPDTRELRFLFVGSMPIDLVTGQVASVVGGAAQRTINAGQGAAVGPDFTGSNYLKFADTPGYDAVASASLFFRGVLDGTSGGYRCLISKNSLTGFSNCPWDFLIDSPTGVMQLVRANASDGRIANANSTLSPGVLALAVSMPAAMESLPTFYLNGTSDGGTFTFGTGTGPATTNNEGLRLGVRPDGAVITDGAVEIAAQWSRELSADEHRRIARNPYSLLKPVRRRLYIIATGLAGNASGVTITAPASMLAGAATGAAARAGVTLTDTASLIAGAATGAAARAGVTLTDTASLIAGAATGAAAGAGVTFTATASIIAGAASAGTSAPGVTFTVTASLLAGAATGAASRVGTTFTATASFIAGGASAGTGIPGNASGVTLTRSISFISGAAVLTAANAPESRVRVGGARLETDVRIGSTVMRRPPKTYLH